jgi:hypothetical protein
MADSINQIGLGYPQDFALESCVIITALGQPTDFSKMVVEINYFEDIYSPTITGNLILNDSSGFLNMLGFSGNEYLMLSFGKPGLDTRKISKTFRIFSVSNRGMVKDQNENYILNFCSEETVLSEQYKVSKSYRNKKVSEIIKDILFNQMAVRTGKFEDSNIEETQGTRDIIIPNLKPFEAISWLSTQAISNSPKTEGSPYLFFENYNGFNFKSLQSLYTGNSYKTYKYEPKNTTLPDDARVQDMAAELTNVLAFENISNFDTINSINTGGFANRLYAIDTIRQSYTVNDFDYWDYSLKTEGLDTFPAITNAKNRKGDSANTTYNSVIKIATTNTGQSTYNSYIKSNSPDIKDTFVEKRIPYRTAQLSHINMVRFKISVPGDPLLTVGMVIEFNVPELRTMEDGGRIWDIYYSGRFIITAVRHIINQENKFVTVLEISKESLKTPYYQFNNELPSWKEIRSR